MFRTSRCYQTTLTGYGHIAISEIYNLYSKHRHSYTTSSSYFIIQCIIGTIWRKSITDLDRPTGSISD